MICVAHCTLTFGGGRAIFGDVGVSAGAYLVMLERDFPWLALIW